MADPDSLREPPSGQLVTLRPAGPPAVHEPPRPHALAVGPGLLHEPALLVPVETGGEQYPVSRAKVMPPPLREATLSRDRLLEWLDGHVHRRCITVVAETGFGKTTLLTDFTRRFPARCLWYRLDRGDADPVSFANYVVAAARELLPSFGVHTLALLRDMFGTRPSNDLVISTLIAELAALGDRSTLFILDDYHVVDEDPRARALIARLLAEAPDRMSFALLSRRQPRLPLGRLVARGEAAHLGSDDLRFSADETERLFRDVYHQPLEPEVLRQVEARTEGWAAGLQLLHSSIRGRSPHDVRAFVRSISGAEGPLYDYLAEEVMAELPPDVQRFLTCTSILDDVTLEFAAAIFAADDPPPTLETVEAWAEAGHRAGLMARHSVLSTNRRYHPLMREFLARRLELLVTPDELREMHLRVARVAEATDWLTSCRHYIAAAHRGDALRVLSANAAKVLGSGQWGDGADLIRTLDASDEDPRIAVILAREAVYAGHIDEGLARLERFDLAELDGPTRGLVVQARVHALWWLTRMSAIVALIDDVLPQPDIPVETAGMLRAARALIGAAQDQPLADAENALQGLLRSIEGTARQFYEGVTYHDLLHVHLAQGEHSRALDAGYRAVQLFRSIVREPDDLRTARVGLARVLSERGQWAEARAELDLALKDDGIGRDERRIEAAGLLAVHGEVPYAKELLEAAGQGDAPDDAKYLWRLNGAKVALADGRPSEALVLLDLPIESLQVVEPGSWIEWLAATASTLVVLDDRPAAARVLQRAMRILELQRANGYRGRLRVLAALTGAAPASAIDEGSDMDLLAAADAIAASLGQIDIGSERLQVSVEGWPARWLPLLRRAIASARPDVAVAAATLLDRFGELSDVRTLRLIAKNRASPLRGSNIGRELARRKSPRMVIHDLGQSWFEVGTRKVGIASIRRRSAGLLCFLLTRNHHLAPRDQVLEALWPEFDPEAGVNSLNQTLYFLRRDIDPAYDDDYSASYVRFESDLVALDPELTSAASAQFRDRVSRALMPGAPVDEGISVVASYGGRFAPEFEYEEWAASWRELLHGQYLHLAESLVAQLISSQRLREAADIAVRVLHVDGAADHVERELIWLYGSLGARSAAAEQYGHYAAMQRQEYGVEPPTLDEIVGSGRQ